MEIYFPGCKTPRVTKHHADHKNMEVSLAGMDRIEPSAEKPLSMITTHVRKHGSLLSLTQRGRGNVWKSHSQTSLLESSNVSPEFRATGDQMKNVVILNKMMDCSGLEIVGNIWDPSSTQLNEIYHKELSFLVILVPKCYLKTKNMSSQSSNKGFSVEGLVLVLL